MNIQKKASLPVHTDFPLPEQEEGSFTDDRVLRKAVCSGVGVGHLQNTKKILPKLEGCKKTELRKKVDMDAVAKRRVRARVAADRSRIKKRTETLELRRQIARYEKTIYDQNLKIRDILTSTTLVQENRRLAIENGELRVCMQHLETALFKSDSELKKQLIYSHDYDEKLQVLQEQVARLASAHEELEREVQTLEDRFMFANTLMKR